MPVITLTTDFGTKDHYVAALRATLLRQLPGASFIEIAHVAPYDIASGAFVLSNVIHEFPAGTVHVVAIDSGGSGRYDHVALQMGGQFFVGCNNGLFSLLSDKHPDRIIQLAESGREPSTFIARDLYLPAAIKLATGVDITKLGKELGDISRLGRPVSPPEDNMLKGIVQYVDAFGNVITNITGEEFDRIGNGRAFEIELFRDRITELHRTYGDVEFGEKVAFFNSSGVLEIAVNRGNASGLLNLKLNSVIRIAFT